jgi:hypothetical protein
VSAAARTAAFNEVFSALGHDPHAVDDGTKRVVWDAMCRLFRESGWKPPPPAGATQTQESSNGPTVFPPFGRSKGTAIRGAAIDTLRFYEGAAVRTLADPAKARFHTKEQALLDVIRAELRRQGEAGNHD